VRDNGKCGTTDKGEVRAVQGAGGVICGRGDEGKDAFGVRGTL